MSDYVKERAERVLGLLDEEDGKVMAEYIRNREAEAGEAQRRRYDGPPWGLWLLLALLVGPALGAGSHAGVGCLRDRRVQLAGDFQTALGACQEELVEKREAIVSLSKACGGER